MFSELSHWPKLCRIAPSISPSLGNQNVPATQGASDGADDGSNPQVRPSRESIIHALLSLQQSGGGLYSSVSDQSLGENANNGTTAPADSHAALAAKHHHGPSMGDHAASLGPAPMVGESEAASATTALGPSSGQPDSTLYVPGSAGSGSEGMQISPVIVPVSASASSGGLQQGPSSSSSSSLKGEGSDGAPVAHSRHVCVRACAFRLAYSIVSRTKF